jgi:hypothetical protein
MTAANMLSSALRESNRNIGKEGRQKELQCEYRANVNHVAGPESAEEGIPEKAAFPSQPQIELLMGWQEGESPRYSASNANQG